jgi:hypothetical protein
MMDIWEKEGQPFDVWKSRRWKIYRCIGCNRRLRKADKRRIARYENGLVCYNCDNKETQRRMMRLQVRSRKERNFLEKYHRFYNEK